MSSIPTIRRCFNLVFSALVSLFLLSSSSVLAQIQDRPKPGPEQKQLEVWVGEWKYEGSLMDTPLGPGGKFAGKMSTRMILDGLFLESRGQDKGVYGGKKLVYKSLMIQWYDPIKRIYVDGGYDNDGTVGRGETTVNGSIWTKTGTVVDSKGKTNLFKSVSSIATDGKLITTKSELSVDDGKTWIPYWQSTNRKIGK